MFFDRKKINKYRAFKKYINRDSNIDPIDKKLIKKWARQNDYYKVTVGIAKCDSHV